MGSNWFRIVVGVCLALLRTSQVMGQFLNPHCGLSDPTSIRVVNGVDAPPGSAPFMAYLMKNYKYHSGGSIISQTYVLTAAHCVVPGLMVRLGEYDDRTNQDCMGNVCIPQHEDFGIVYIAHHNQYNNVTLANDIALIKLSRRITFKLHIQPICLYRYSRRVPRVWEYVAFGWGHLDSHQTEAHVLQTTNMERHPKSHCETPYRWLTRNQICVGSLYSDTCRGDSGSPLVIEVKTYDGNYQFVQLGIVSFGNKRCSGPGVYTYVPHYATWILDKMRFIDHKYPHI